ncbi:hypothetical protein HGH92_32270 [Chitinophaga varians]|uniref:Uncharacterized protein n=1 Tax=Chitinophaga varians TaxID=2202339 RepID=A0A847S0T5_9BACT|nr:hypothetical protein [Chitinophaga varians]NLR69022.1 hypothetical protein [Chitinophaga varians]
MRSPVHPVVLYYGTILKYADVNGVPPAGGAATMVAPSLGVRLPDERYSGNNYLTLYRAAEG